MPSSAARTLGLMQAVPWVSECHGPVSIVTVRVACIQAISQNVSACSVGIPFPIRCEQSGTVFGVGSKVGTTPALKRGTHQ